MTQYARVAWGRLRPQAWGEYERLYTELVIPQTAELSGLTRRILLRSVDEPDEGISVSLWENLDALRAYRTGDLYRSELQPALNHLFNNDWWSKEYEVRVDR
jgi:heme-degrading monooxygenase HmoA